MENNDEEAQHDRMRAEKNMYRKVVVFAAEFMLGFTFIMAIFLVFISIFVALGYFDFKTPPIPFQLHSLDLALDLDLASDSTNSSLAFSVHNPLPDSVYFHVAEASVSYKSQVVGFKLMDPFRVMMGEYMVLSVVMSPRDASFGFARPHDTVLVGFEFRVESLVKIHDDSVTEKFGLVRVVCGKLEVRFSTGSSVGALAGGPRNCRSSWEYF